MSSVVGFVIGAILGSFAKAVADRINRKESIGGRSYCQKCKTSLRWYDLFPVLSFILLKGRCRYCRKKIPFGNFASEVVLGIVGALLTASAFPSGLSAFSLDSAGGLLLFDLLFKLFIAVVTVIIFWTDTATGLIPDRVTYPAMAVAFTYLFLSSGIRSWVFYQNLASNPFGKYLLPPYSSYLWDNLGRIWLTQGLAVFAAVSAALIFILLIIFTKGRGMGWGDVKYVFWLGLSLGFPLILPAVFLAFLTGAVFSLGLILLGRKRFGQTIPFGPFLGIGAVLALLYGSQLMGWYV